MANNGEHRDWVETIFKIMGGLGVFIASIFIPLVLHWNSEKNSNNQLYAQIVSERERADADLRAKMLENLIKSFFGDASQKKTVKEKITLLRLLALNFHESFNLKPLFEELDSELKGDDRMELRKVASEIRGKQEAMLSQVEDGMFFEMTILEGEENGIMIPPKGEKAYRGHRLGIVATEMDKDDDYVKLRIMDMPEGNTTTGNTSEITFKLSDYDMPFIDNTKLFNHTRFAITLSKDIGKDADGKMIAAVKIIFFPEAYMSGRDRPYLDEMLAQLRQTK